MPAPRPPSPAAATPRVAAVTVLGLGGEELDKVLDLVSRQSAALGGRSILITDAADFTPFRRRGLVVEQIVSARARAADRPDLAWATYERRLYALIHARWRPTVVTTFGRDLDEACLSALRAGR